MKVKYIGLIDEISFSNRTHLRNFIEYLFNIRDKYFNNLTKNNFYVYFNYKKNEPRIFIKTENNRLEFQKTMENRFSNKAVLNKLKTRAIYFDLIDENNEIITIDKFNLEELLNNSEIILDIIKKTMYLIQEETTNNELWVFHMNQENGFHVHYIYETI